MTQAKINGVINLLKFVLLGTGTKWKPGTGGRQWRGEVEHSKTETKS